MVAGLGQSIAGTRLARRDIRCEVAVECVIKRNLGLTMLAVMLSACTPERENFYRGGLHDVAELPLRVIRDADEHDRAVAGRLHVLVFFRVTQILRDVGHGG